MANRFLLLFGLLGTAQWFFGNFYEAVVLAPNMLSSTAAKLAAWQGYFTSTNPIFYYVPLTQLAMAAVWASWYRAPAGSRLRGRLAKASLLGLAALLLTGYIVTQLNLQLFFGDLAAQQAQLPAMALRWNVLNLVRVGLLGGCLFQVYRAHLLSAAGVTIS
ncbi:hypothetical protein [Hymenobacter armeniacus]|uniref:DUF1772 domain-containing protein n=1 Tax=Hymenobacter armeniacus TaxID=2771358 RepID=A0ABR8JUK3_9BACT|nr:hypothetical protein [Hymenobacter armeniacus]MBD2723637.1 hypothetical protein [Hymenobacter armeniacus]